jgi:predicted amidohydrolase
MSLFDAFRVSAHSIPCVPGGTAENLKKIENWATRAAEKGVRLAVFPELCVQGYWMAPDARRVAEAIDGPSVKELTRIAESLELIISAGITELRGRDLFNTQVFVGPKGLIGYQSKTHVTPLRESECYRSDTEYHLIRTELCDLGCAICYDNHFSEASLIPEKMGATVLVMPFCCGRCTSDSLQTDSLNQMEYRTRCRDTGMFGVLANQCGRRDNDYYYGTWCGVIDPNGEYLARTEPGTEGEHMVLADISPEPYIKRLQERPSRHRRFEDFKALVDYP